ncbi:MAG TPA: hypothetical protein DCY13_01155 [Verrucomicrobiales bacterium]|nr:hypothetical protein [Verrucomicrobiales bacterium]
MLADEKTSAEQYAIYRKMLPAKRLALAESLYWSARKLKAAWLRGQHGDWSDEKVSAEVTRLFTHARS